MRLIRTNEGARRLEELIDNDPGGSLTFEVPTREGAEVLVGLDGGPSVPAKAQDTGHTASLRIAARASSRYPAGPARRRVWYRLLREQLLHLRVAQLILLPAGLCNRGSGFVDLTLHAETRSWSFHVRWLSR